MAAHLPRDSTTFLAVQPMTEIEQWNPQAWLLAQAVDQLAGGNWQRGGGKGARPKPTPRPKPPKSPRPELDHREVIRRFKAWYAAQPGGRG